MSHLEVVDRTLEESTVSGVREVAEVDDPNEDTNDSNNLCELLSKVVDLLLERSLLADLGGDGGVDVAERGLGTGGGDDCEALAGDDGGSLRARSSQTPGGRTQKRKEDARRRAC